jgi:hypothetical protein
VRPPLLSWPRARSVPRLRPGLEAQAASCSAPATAHPVSRATGSVRPDAARRRAGTGSEGQRRRVSASPTRHRPMRVGHAYLDRPSPDAPAWFTPRGRPIGPVSSDCYHRAGGAPLVAGGASMAAGPAGAAHRICCECRRSRSAPLFMSHLCSIDVGAPPTRGTP